MRLVITLYDKEKELLDRMHEQAQLERSKVSYADIIREAIRRMAKQKEGAA